MKHAAFMAFALLLLGALAGARAVDPVLLRAGVDAVITLENDDVIKGRVTSVTGDAATIEHAVLGPVTIPFARMKAVALTETPEEARHVAAEAAKAVAPPPAPPPIPEEAKLSFWDGWTGQVEAGLAGSDGNSETFNGRAGLLFKRLTDEMESLASATYTYASDAGEKSKSRGEIFFRNDWFFKDSPWGFFAQGRAEYDEFQDWDFRLSAFAGPTYTVIKNDTTTFRLRAGAGITREFGGESNEIIPEALFGFNFNHKLTQAQSVFVDHEYLPSLKTFSDYRMVTKGGYEIMIDPEIKMSLKLGLEDRYDSMPGDGRKKNDIDYFALLAWSF